jgi:predicted dehydrogenase
MRRLLLRFSSHLRQESRPVSQLPLDAQSTPKTSRNRATRRQFLKTSAAAAAATSVPFWFAKNESPAADFVSPNERPTVGCIGTGSQWMGYDGPRALQFFDCVALCDVDRDHLEHGLELALKHQKKRPAKIDLYGDYRKLLDRKDIDVVTIVVPDHWHTKIAIEAMQAGKDVYCEKPLTLTIDEGKQIIKTLDATKRVFQVGTQQRSEMHLNFLRAVAMVRDGRIGTLKRAICDIGGSPTSQTLDRVPPPKSLDWEMWLGQAPKVDYMEKHVGKELETRAHYEFRWWYEYSGGKLTDWGAHHVDIAQWAITGDNMAHTGPHTIEPVHCTFPVPFKNGYPTVDNRYNTATKFTVRCMFDGDVEIVIKDSIPEGNGIVFEGTKGRFHVGRGIQSLFGEPVTELEKHPLPADLLTHLYKGKKPGHHMRNFAECVKTREQPVSDVYTHHRAITTCHLANIAMRLGRKIKWDPQTEEIVGDPEARKWQSREQRKGYEIHA